MPRRFCYRRLCSGSCCAVSVAARATSATLARCAFLDNPYVSLVPVGATTADRYSRIAASLRAKGCRIPTNDVWIAAHAMETGADLVSADRRFEHVDGIAWIRLKGERGPTWPTV